ncbi:MAG TPA: PIG-L deacetylase family protein [Candidatus Saccharimonadaceae bacterium]|nr:PIG-L deacetylase family protein [Candidatus Saccharimonadaceae bacterium]
MQKVIFGIFAHPDDEAFGPSGYFIKEVHDGTELHLITLTLGEAGMNPDGHADLAAVREKEWRRGGELMGAASMHFLGFKDGQLNNTSMIVASKKLVELVGETISGAPNDVVIDFITSDLNGISGHIDHIVAARAASWAFYTLKQHDARLTKIKYACIPYSQFPDTNVDWLYMEPGRHDNEIDEVVDARDYRAQIIEVMRAHHTQREDGEMHIRTRKDALGMNYFIVKA